MCLIVDANRAGLVFSIPPDPELAPILEWLESRAGCLVVGGHLARELERMAKAKRMVITMLRDGRARWVNNETVAREEAVVRGTGRCESNDPHVVALARVSGARTLCSEDKDLWCDFQNQHLVAKPRGKIYRNASHVHLLRHTASCGRQRGNR